jgi:hypothetical protein
MEDLLTSGPRAGANVDPVDSKNVEGHEGGGVLAGGQSRQPRLGPCHETLEGGRSGGWVETDEFAVEEDPRPQVRQPRAASSGNAAVCS